MTKTQDVAEVVDAVALAVADVDQGDLALLKRVPEKVRNVVYTVGILLGAAATIAPVIASLLTGDAQSLTISLGGLALALSNALAKANLKP